MADKDANQDGSTQSERTLYPNPNTYCAKNIRDLKKGDKKLWCTCGLSKKQPWCDGSHKGTGFKPLKWKVPHTQTLYQICCCKYTSNPPYCDGTHTTLPMEVLDRQKACPAKEKCHNGETKLCTGCGWVPDF